LRSTCTRFSKLPARCAHSEQQLAKIGQEKHEELTKAAERQREELAEAPEVRRVLAELRAFKKIAASGLAALAWERVRVSIDGFVCSSVLSRYLAF